MHGCCDELEALLQNLGYEPAQRDGDDPVWGNRSYRHPEGRKAVFLGDLVDRGPRILDTLRLVRNMVATGSALCVPGNHDMKLMRKLRGKDVQITHGLASRWPRSRLCPKSSPDASPEGRPSSSTGWSATTCWTTASWWWPTPA